MSGRTDHCRTGGRRRLAASLLFAAAASAMMGGAGLLHPPPALAQKAGPLPGGASSLDERHGDWIVACRLGTAGEGAPVKLCAMSQQQTTRKGQRAVSIELVPGKGGATGALVLPFGLAVAQGVTLAVDEAPAGERRPFSTCLPVGCIVPLQFGAEMVAGLRSGKSLIVTAATADGTGVRLAISLAGFSSAMDRTAALKS